MKRVKTILDHARLGARLDGLFIFDAHQHVGGWHRLYLPAHEAADLIRAMDRIGIAGSCASSTAAGVGSDSRAGNDLVVAATKAWPGRMRGYIVADPNLGGGLGDEIERCAAEGLKALKVHNYHGKPYDAIEYHVAYEIADSRAWPVLVHSGDDLGVLDRLAAQYKEIRWIFAHAAGADARKFCEIARRHENVYLDTANSVCPWNAVEALVEHAGAEKVLFGSDAAFISLTQQLGKILFARLTDTEKELLLGLNAKRVFDLPGQENVPPRP